MKEMYDDGFEEGLEGELAELEGALREALRVEAPAELAERICAATAGGMDGRLRAALRVEAPAGLSERVWGRSVGGLGRRRGVLGRIGVEGAMVRWAAAMMVLLGGAVWLSWQHEGAAVEQGAVAVMDGGLAEELASFERSMDAVDGGMERQMAALALEMEEAMWAVREEPMDRFDAAARQLDEELTLLEAAWGWSY